MKKEVLKKLIQEKAEELQKQRIDDLESKGWLEGLYLKVNGYTVKNYNEALIEVLAELL